MLDIQDQEQLKRPLVSFIITAYNLPITLLRECIESILALSLADDERQIILVDDGSKVSPMSELMDLADRLVYIRQANGGPSMARNTGLRVATGQYVQFVDGDDKLIPANYDHCLDLVRYNEADMVLFDLTDEEQAKPLFEMPEPTDGTVYMSNHNLQGSACAYIFRRDILHGLRFTPGLYHEDEEFTAQIFLRAEKVYSTNTLAYYYRKREGSRMRNPDKKQIIKRLNDFETVVLHLHDITWTLPKMECLAMQRRVAQLTMDYIFNIIVLTKSSKQLAERVERLKAKGLYPLPEQDYTQKYKWFRRLANTEIGLKVLLRTLPFVRKKQ